MKNALFVLVFAGLLGGCARLHTTPKANYNTIKASPTRNTKVARRKHHRALNALANGDAVTAEQLLNESLLADRDFGPAHNSLGKLYFDQRKFYLAAWEFEYANKLMSGRAEPLNNIGLVMEAVGRLEEAVSYYQQATELDSENPQYLGNLLRAKIRQGTDPSILREDLQQLVLIDPRPEWSDWAKSLLVKNEINGGIPHEYAVPIIPGNAIAPGEIIQEPPIPNGNEALPKRAEPKSLNPKSEPPSPEDKLNPIPPLKFPSSRR